MIPEHAHFYWGHDYMPWVRYLTLKTFRRQNPDWLMSLWVPTRPVHVEGERPLLNAYVDPGPTVPQQLSPDYLPLVSALGVTVHPIDVEALTGVELGEFVPSVHVREQIKADYLRLWLLAEFGGLSADMDILFYRSMHALPRALAEHLPNSALVKPQSIVTWHCGVYYWGFMLSVKDGAHFRRMWDAARRVDPAEFQRGHNFYRVAGHLATQLWGARLPPGMLNLPFHTIYHDSDRFDADDEISDPPWRLGVHWHGASSYGTWIRATPETWRGLPPSLMRRCVARVEG